MHCLPIVLVAAAWLPCQTPSLVKDVNPAPLPLSSNPDDFQPAGGLIYFSANGDSTGLELYRTLGSPGSTSLVADIQPGLGSSLPKSLTAVGPLVFFSADNGTHGRELFRSDGTAAGTYLVRDIQPGPSG